MMSFFVLNVQCGVMFEYGTAQCGKISEYDTDSSDNWDGEETNERVRRK